MASLLGTFFSRSTDEDNKITGHFVPVTGVTFSCVLVSLTSYTAESVPTSSFATVQGIMHGAYFGLGSGMGHLIGGTLIGYFGARITFFAFAASCLVVLFLFMAAQKVSEVEKNLCLCSYCVLIILTVRNHEFDHCWFY